MISDYLNNRSQTVKDTFGNFSETCNDTWGVPQGSVLRPLLFSIFINNLPNVLEHCTPLLFADDTTLLISCYPHDLSSTLLQLESNIARVVKWLQLNLLNLNSEKTEVMVLGSPANIKKVGQIQVCVDGTVIQSKESVRIRGFYIDCTFSCKLHISMMLRRAYGQISQLFMLRPVISKDNMIILIKAMVFPLVCSPYRVISKIKHHRYAFTPPPPKGRAPPTPRGYIFCIPHV